MRHNQIDGTARQTALFRNGDGAGQVAMGRAVLRAVYAIVLVAIVAVAVFLLYRGWRQYQNAEALAIRTPNGIQETMFVPIGGIEQWIQIRGDDRSNPVLLFMHGGPGNSESALSALFRPWEKYFTVVMWDQRCASKTFERNGAASCNGMSVNSVAKEGVQLSQFLEKHLHHRKIIILGHSWGTMIGVQMIHDRPDLFSAYVGTGQAASVAEKEPIIYARTMARLQAAHADSDIARLKTVHPPYHSLDEIRVERDLSDEYDIPSERDLRTNLTTTVLFAPDWSPLDIYWFLNSGAYAENATINDINRFNAHDLGPEIKVPFFIFNGAEDNITPTVLARHYFDFVRAPHKKFVAFPGAGHSAVLTEPDVFLHELVTRVRPIAIQNETGAALHG
ncbi:MAG TPA: alpha/beta hydrolase [Rhizomicrobium sp.]|nr:alpha/beta hydrolase [Rhizomicrobium sp.]